MVWRLDYDSIETPSLFQIQLRQFSNSTNPRSLNLTFELVTKSGYTASTSIKTAAKHIEFVTEVPETIGVVMTDGCSLISPVVSLLSISLTFNEI